MKNKNIENSRQRIRYLKLLGKGWQGEITRDGLIYFKKGFSFISNLELRYGTEIRTEDEIGAPAIIHLLHGFKKKGIGNTDLYVRKEFGFMDHEFLIKMLKKFDEIDDNQFKHVRFEKLFGIELNRKKDDAWYYSYSGGISYLNITDKMPKKMKEKLETVLATGIRELHESGIEYIFATPINFRYDFTEKLICNPNVSVEFRDKPDDGINDLAKLLYTHYWITDKKKFIKKYLGKEFTNEKYRELIKDTDYIISEAEKLEWTDLPTFWSRNKKLLRKCN